MSPQPLDRLRNLADRLPDGDQRTAPDALYDAFVGWAGDQGFELYPAQQDAVLELVTGAGLAEQPGHVDDPAVPGDDVVGLVVMDEFRFYADPQRGWARQVPLLELPRTQFLLMSATLGDVSFFVDDLQRRTGRDVAAVTNTDRPVPLTFSYAIDPLHELIEQLVGTLRAPVYLVHFTQRDAVEQAQALASARPCPGCCGTASGCTTRGCCPATDGSWSGSPSAGC